MQFRELHLLIVPKPFAWYSRNQIFMKSLHLLANTSSMLSNTVQSLRLLGHEAYGVVYARNYAQSNDQAGCDVIVEAPRNKRVLRILRKWQAASRAARLIREVDVVHWYNGLAAEASVDLWLARRLGKKGIVEFVGGDIRNSSIGMKDNPFYAEAWESGRYEYMEETAEHSKKTQEAFLKFGMKGVFSYATMDAYLLEGRWAQRFPIRARLNTKEFVPRYSERTESPLIVHMSTAPICKGTEQLEEIIERLCGSYSFRYERIAGLSREQALNKLAETDIYLDQFVLGEGCGIAALEAMALGKCVVTYTKDSLLSAWNPEEVGFVNASLLTLETRLVELIENHSLRQELGIRSRSYVEQKHDGLVVASQIAKDYETLLAMS